MSGEARRFASAIKAAGGTACLVRDSGRLVFSASIQPRAALTEPESEPLGMGAAELYTLYAAADDKDALPDAGDTVEWQGHAYHVLGAEPFYFREDTVYLRAVLRKGAVL